MVALSVWVLRFMYEQAAADDPTVTLPAAALSTDSITAQTEQQSQFSLRSRDNKLYRPRQKGAAGVYEFLKKDIRVNRGTDFALRDLPSELEPVKIINDQEDPFLRVSGKAANRKHYFFRQKLKNLEVFGSQVTVHQVNDEDIYALNGAMIEDQTLEPERIPEERAQRIVLDAARARTSGQITIEGTKKVALNPNFVGLSDDEKTYPALVVRSTETVGLLATPRRTIVSLTDGSILQSVEMVDYAMNRMVYNCNENPTGQCTLTRQEGSPPSGQAEPDSMYNYLGEIYTFYKSKMNRDSYDNQGGTIRAFVNLPTELNGEKICPNARWIRAEGQATNQLQTCPGWNTRDIDAHEFTHGVVEYTANLDFMDQSGALNEAIADIFAVGIDSDDWQIGEDLSIGAIRHLDDPSKNRNPTSSGGSVSSPMPDTMFSQRYYCGTGDRGGVHVNMTVPTKAFYLMVVGGNFNGCAMTGLGKDKALLVWYQALTKYLGQTSNFRNLYDGLLQGCADLYGATSNECMQVTKSAQAVELDQQPLGEQKGPTCLNIARKTPSCVSNNPTTPPTQTPSTTPALTGVACTNVIGDGNGDGKVTLTDYGVWKKAFTQ